MGWVFFPEMIPGVFPTGCLSTIAPVPPWLLSLSSRHLTRHNPRIAFHRVAGRAWCMLLLVNFRLPHGAGEFRTSDARLCYTGAFSDSFQLVPRHLEMPWIGNKEK